MTLRVAMTCAFGAVLAIGAAAACSDKIQPTGSTLVVDAPPPTAEPVSDAQPPVYEASVPTDAADDAYYAHGDADLAACDTCGCSKSTSYCFGGGTIKAAIVRPQAADAAAADAGPTTCKTASGATPQIGCNTIPAACAATPTCACIIDTLQPSFRCYLNCADDGEKWLVYCPNP